LGFFNTLLVNYHEGQMLKKLIRYIRGPQRSERLKVFERLYNKGGWDRGDGETVSGAGSTLAYTIELRKMLPSLLNRLSVKMILDVPCGDFNWFKHVDIGAVKYTGMDIVPELIKANRKAYRSRRRKFIQGDATVDPLPRADLMICRDLFRHLSIGDCYAVLEAFVQSKTPWLLVTSYIVDSNRDIDAVMGSRPLNLQVAPFNFPPPEQTFPDWIEGYRERYLCLWSRDDVIRSTAGSIKHIWNS
jgi:hypothetical protein